MPLHATGDDADFFSSLRTAPPVDTRYVAGRWHRDRITLKGFNRELRSIARAAITPRNQDVVKFLILGRPRSGTSLLSQLLESQSDIHCDREVLSKNVVAPVAYLDRLAVNSRSQVYGAKLLSYQMIQVQRIADPVQFLAQLRARGFHFIHITRNSFFQVLSLDTAVSTGVFATSDPSRRAKVGEIVLDPTRFVEKLLWSEKLLAYETRALGHFPHDHVSYEEDLMDADRHAPAIARLCETFGVPPQPVSSLFKKKLLPTDPRKVIANFDEIVAAMEAQRLGHMLPELH